MYTFFKEELLILNKVYVIVVYEILVWRAGFQDVCGPIQNKI
jgi:hypothetical protein